MREYKIVVAGNGGVGKSALTVRFVQGQFVTYYDATIEDSYRKHIQLDGEDCRMEILDTAGTEQFSGMRDLYVRNGQGFLLVYSIDDPSSLAQVEQLANYIERVKEGKVPLVLVGNKMDLESDRRVTLEEGRSLARKLGCIHHETSAKGNHRVNEIFLDCARLIKMNSSASKEKRRTIRSGQQTAKKPKERSNCCTVM